jgi:hypothetical protein
MGLKLTLPDAEQKLYTHHLWAICQYLTTKVIQPFFAQNNVRWDSRFVEFFTHSRNSNPFEPIGVIEFYPPLRFAGQSESLEQGIREALTSVGIELGKFERELYSGQPAVKVVRIPILKNPTAQSGPPEVTMPNNAGRIIMTKLLGYQARNGRYECPVDDVLCKACVISDDLIARQCSSPLVDKTANGGGAKRVRAQSSPITVNSVRRCLDELKTLARWAREHNYQTISASI